MRDACLLTRFNLKYKHSKLKQTFIPTPRCPPVFEIYDSSRRRVGGKLPNINLISACFFFLERKKLPPPTSQFSFRQTFAHRDESLSSSSDKIFFMSSKSIEI